MSYNSNSIISFLDDSFNADDLKHAMLCVGLGTSRISLTLFDGEAKKVVMFKSLKPALTGTPGSKAYEELYTDTLRGIADKREVDFTKAGEIKVYIENEHYSLVPESLYNSDEKQLYLDLDQEIYKENEFVILQNPLASHKLINVFAIPVSLKENIDKFFPGASIMHHLSVIFHQLDENGFSVHVGSNTLDLIYFNDGLKFCQTFPYHSAEDVLYHITHVSGRLGIDIKVYPVTLMGEINEGSDGYSMIKEYFGDLNLIDFRDESGFVKDTDKIQPHHFYTLFSLKNCE